MQKNIKKILTYEVRKEVNRKKNKEDNQIKK